MDPTECLTQLLLAITDDDADLRNELYYDLANWLDRGGFVPDIDAAYERFCQRSKE